MPCEPTSVKIFSFLFESESKDGYSWCGKAPINIGWSSLSGLKEWCNSGKNPYDFKLKKSIMVPPRVQISKFGEVINLFKQEIEIRADFKNLESIFSMQKNELGKFKLNLASAKLSNRQFYTDTQKFSWAIAKIFSEIKKRNAFPNIEVISVELEDRSIELKITQFEMLFADKFIS